MVLESMVHRILVNSFIYNTTSRTKAAPWRYLRHGCVSKITEQFYFSSNLSNNRKQRQFEITWSIISNQSAGIFLTSEQINDCITQGLSVKEDRFKRLKIYWSDIKTQSYIANFLLGMLDDVSLRNNLILCCLVW